MSHKPEHPEKSNEQSNVQYIVTEKSLEGLSGWLVFWMVIFGLAGLGYIVTFFAIIEGGLESASSIVNMISAPILAVGFIMSTILIALRQKLGQTISIATIAICGLLTSLLSIIVATESTYSSMAATASFVLVSLVASGLIILYFVISKRVQKTLNK